MNKNQVSDTIFEALFRQAIIDDFNEEIDAIPENEELAKSYSFSVDFEIQMKKLLIRDRIRSYIKNAMFYSKKVASILVIALVLLFGTLLFNTEVRAVVGKVVVEYYDKFTSFTFRDDGIISEKKDWSLNYLPKGYTMKSSEVIGRITSIEFINEDGNKIRFSYQSAGSTINISVANENHNIDRFEMLNNEAYCISALDDKFDNGIIWNMEGYTFNLWSKISVDELKKIAESISGE